MQFKKGDKVKIIPSEQTFYSGIYNLTTCVGTVESFREGCVYVCFGNLITPFTILSRDLELEIVKNQQLLFNFMND